VPGSSGAEPATSSRGTAGDGELDGGEAEATAVDGVDASEGVADGDGAGPQAARSKTVAATGIQRLGTREPYPKAASRSPRPLLAARSCRVRAVFSGRCRGNPFVS